MAHEIDALFMFGDDLEAILDFTNYGSGQSFFVAVFISTERYFHFYSFFFFYFFFTFFFLAFTTIPIQPFFCYVGGVLSKGSCVRSGLHVEQQCVLKYL